MKNVYFIGIGGIGMSAIARYYNQAGYCVSGYDKTESNLTKKLEQEGIKVHYCDDISHVPADKNETLVIYTPAIPNEMGELRYVMENGYKVVKRSRALGEISSDKFTSAVAGTHGKTTTSTLLSHIYTHSGTGCSAFLGGISKNYSSNLLVSKSNILVAEADEFDRSFLQLFPDIAIITSIDADHLDIYQNEKALHSAFEEFASQIKADGALVLKKGVELGLDKVKASVYSYSITQDADFCAMNIEILQGGYFKFDLKYPQGVIEGCVMGTPGRVNCENGVAAAAAALLGGISPLQVKEALATFKGVERRMDIQVNSGRYAYIDDYAHHPKELTSAICSIRDIFPGRKICGIFQPHLYSRTRDFAKEFAESLSLLDELILLDIYPAREKPIEGVDSMMIFKDVTIKEKTLIDKEALMEYLQKRDFDILATFGAGNIDRFIAPIRQMLIEREAKEN